MIECLLTYIISSPFHVCLVVSPSLFYPSLPSDLCTSMHVRLPFFVVLVASDALPSRLSVAPKRVSEKGQHEKLAESWREADAFGEFRGVLARKADAFGYPFQLTHFSLPISAYLFQGPLSLACFRWRLRLLGLPARFATANLPTKIVDFRGFDSSIMLILRGGIPRPIWDFPESLSQAMLVGTMLVGRLGVGARQYLGCTCTACLTLLV